MSTPRLLASTSAALFAIVALGCAANASDAASDGEDQLRFSAEVNAGDHSNVGIFQRYYQGPYYKHGIAEQCTATLVGSNVALTSSGCVDARPWHAEESYVLEIRFPDRNDDKLSWTNARSFRVRATDAVDGFGILILESPVPGNIAVPMEMVANDSFWNGFGTVNAYGYGCSEAFEPHDPDVIPEIAEATLTHASFRPGFGGLQTLFGESSNRYCSSLDYGAPIVQADTGKVQGVLGFPQDATNRLTGSEVRTDEIYTITREVLAQIQEAIRTL